MAFVVSFSGHRPNKLGGWNWEASFNRKIRDYYKGKLRELIFEHKGEELIFVSGMAEGFDMFMAAVILELKEEYPGIKLVAAVPFLKQPDTWYSEDIVQRYHSLLRNADRVVFVDDIKEYRVKDIPVGEYHVAKLFNRNDWMTSIMDLGIVLYDGSKIGGTKDFLSRAMKRGKPLEITNPRDI